MKPYKRRVIWLSVILLAVFGTMFGRLYTMMLKSSDTYQTRASTKSTKTITVYGKRGTIYDTNMVPLAYDETSYNVTFYRDPTQILGYSTAPSYTQVLIKTIQLIESNGKSTVNDFWLKQNERRHLAL